MSFHKEETEKNELVATWTSNRIKLVLEDTNSGVRFSVILFGFWADNIAKTEIRVGWSLLSTSFSPWFIFHIPGGDPEPSDA